MSLQDLIPMRLLSNFYQYSVNIGYTKFTHHIHAYIICFLMVAWNTQIFIFGWCENILMGISFIKNSKMNLY